VKENTLFHIISIVHDIVAVTYTGPELETQTVSATTLSHYS
jgi:hypothetical protein